MTCQGRPFKAFCKIMTHVLKRGSVLLIGAIFLSAALRPAMATVPTAALSADQIIQKAVERAESPETRQGRPDYRYTKRTVTEELDSKGRLKDTKEKTYEVVVEQGLSYLKLLAVNGQMLSGAEARKQNDKEIAERQKISDGKPGQKGDERENFLTAELVQKYKFTLVGDKMINGRKAYLLSFQPRSADLPIRKLTDRVLNQVAGTVWVDAEEFEISRVEAHLNSEVAMWGGLIGTLRQCDYTLERTRLADGSWFNSFSHGRFEGRKLLEPMMIRTRSQSSNFRRVDLAAK